MVSIIAEIIGGGDVLPYHIDKARKILTALLDPTPKMMDTGGAFLLEGETSDNARAAAIIFSAMINAALQD
jgi:hypothetical protein